MPRRRWKRIDTEPHAVTVADLSDDGYGIATVDDAAVRVMGALPGEQVMVQYHHYHRQYKQASTTEVLRASSYRVSAGCDYFLRCGGCQLQHMSSSYQLAQKQQRLLQLCKQQQVKPHHIEHPMASPQQYGYRRKARLGVRFVAQKNRVLVGFREVNGRYLADIHQCQVLHPAVGQLLTQISELVASLSGYETIPQIECAVAENATALVIRHLLPLTPEDHRQLQLFAQQHQIWLYLQPSSVASIWRLWPEQQRSIAYDLSYSHPDHGVTLHFSPTDFMQVNLPVNRLLVSQAMAWLALKPQDHVLDLFSGVGNFAVVCARYVAQVDAVECCQSMVEAIELNASQFTAGRVRPWRADLSTDCRQQPWAQKPVDKLLLDPSRAGAAACMDLLPQLQPQRLVYCSCGAETFARDAALLQQHGYTLERLQLFDMFPHTTHAESLALFVKSS